MGKSIFARFGILMRRQNMFTFAVMLCLIGALVSTLVSAPFEFGLVDDVKWLPEPDFEVMGWGLIVSAVFVAPLLETLLFQMFPMSILWYFRFFRRRRWFIVLISGLVFGAQHFYSLQYILVTFAIGMLMMWGYIVKYKRHAFWSVALYHFIWNGSICAYQIVESYF